MPTIPVRNTDGIHIIDTLMFGVEGYTASFVIDDDETMVIDAGLSTDVNHVFDGLEDVGVPTEEVDYILVTHAHLDHAGGVPELADECGNATVVCHENAYGYLTDPEMVEELVESTKSAVGPLADAYGTLEPLPEERVETVSGGESYDLGGHVVDVMHTPGHAPHHVSLHETETETLFVVDEGCAYFDGDEVPTTPPPNFDYEKTLESLERFRAREPEALLYGHFGVNYDGVDAVGRHVDALEEWVETVEEAWEEHGNEEEAVSQVLERYDHRVTNPAVEAVVERDARGALLDLRRRRGDLPNS
ncbi:MAG: MBL fold metallo-hydrolase [Halobacteria archaeon]|nr:MBL fold metallo-hydrolase [Halobacteria archaeon]